VEPAYHGDIIKTVRLRRGIRLMPLKIEDLEEWLNTPERVEKHGGLTYADWRRHRDIPDESGKMRKVAWLARAWRESRPTIYYWIEVDGRKQDATS
jgi:hypothetical protein